MDPNAARGFEPEVDRALREHVLPIIAEHPRPKIWHAACATGEEVVSSALLLREEGLDERTAIFATDSSKRSLAAAEVRIAVSDQLAKNICFFPHDLVTDDVFGEMQLVFCRNVLRSFGARLRDEIAVKLGRALAPGAFLCVGRDESLPATVRRRFTELGGSVGIYRYEGHP